MNAPADPRIFNKAVLAAASRTDFAAELSADAEQIKADIRAGRKILTEYGAFTRADLEAAVVVDGGIYFPTLSCGADVADLARAIGGAA